MFVYDGQKAMGSPEWWQIVMSSPMHEAEYLLRWYKVILLAECANKPSQHDTAQVARINAEIHRFGQLQNRANIGNAVKNLFGFEAWEMVKTEAARLEKEAREESGIPPC